jgi:hypothetical protein
VLEFVYILCICSSMHQKHLSPITATLQETVENSFVKSSDKWPPFIRWTLNTYLNVQSWALNTYLYLSTRLRCYSIELKIGKTLDFGWWFFSRGVLRYFTQT